MFEISSISKHVFRHIVVVALLAIAVSSIAGQSQVAVLPSDQRISFSDVRTTGGQDPHASGVEIELYKHAGAWAGFMSQWVGPVADPPVGKLDNLQVDESNGRMSFTAKLSLGVTIVKDTRSTAPTRDLFEFAGTIDANAISGTLSHKRADAPAGRTRQQPISLERQSRDSGTPALSYAGWLKIWNDVMKVRGPKW